MPKNPPTTSDAASAATSRAAARSRARRRVKSAPAVIPRATSTSRDADVDGTDAVNDVVVDAVNDVDVEGAAVSYARAVAASSPVGAVVEYADDARRANARESGPTEDVVERVVGADVAAIADVDAIAGDVARTSARPSVDIARLVHIARARDEETEGRRSRDARGFLARELERLSRATDERTTRGDARSVARRGLGLERNTPSHCLHIR